LADNCGSDVDVTYQTEYDNSGVGSQSDPYILTRVYRMMDACGNYRDIEHLIIVKDKTKPVAPSLTDIEKNCTYTLSAAPTTTDNCGSPITGTTGDYILPHTFDKIGTYPIIWEFDDGNGNSNYVTQNVIIGNNTPPVPTVETLPTITEGCEIAIVATPTATDACGNIFSATTTTAFPITDFGSQEIIWTYTDGNGNINTQTQTVTLTAENVEGGTLLGQINDAVDADGNSFVTEPSHNISVSQCPDDINNVTINLTNYTGEIIHWEIYKDNDRAWKEINNSDGWESHDITFDYSSSVSSLYRVLISSGTCYQYSTIFNIHAVPPDVPPILEEDYFNVCRGDTVLLKAFSGYKILVDDDANDGGTFNVGQFPDKWDPTQWKIDGEVAGAEWTASGNNTKYNNWSGTNNHPVGSLYQIEYDSNDFKFGIAHGNFDSPEYIDEFGTMGVTTLETPIFSLIGVESPSVDFDQAYNLHAGDVAKLEISIDGGLTYLSPPLQELIGTSPQALSWGPVPYPYPNPPNGNNQKPELIAEFNFQDDNSSFDLSDHIGEDNVRIRWSFRGTSDESVWAIDNITIPLEGAYSNIIEWTDGLGKPGEYIIQGELNVAFEPSTEVPGYHEFGATTLINGCRSYDVHGTAFADVYVNYVYIEALDSSLAGECGGNPIYLKAYDNTLTANQNAAKGVYSPPEDCDTCDAPGTGAKGIWSVVSTGSCPTQGVFTTTDAVKYPVAENDPNAIFTGDAGTHTLTWTVEGTDCPASIDVIIEDCKIIDFDGDNDYITFKDEYHLSEPFSIEAWIKPNPLTGSNAENDPIQTIFSKRNGNDLNTASGYDLRLEDNTISFNWNDGGQLKSSKPIDTSRWYHIAVTYDGLEYILYIDGIEMASGAGSGPEINSSHCFIGAMDQSNNPPNKPINHFSGWIDELRIWNKALDIAHIRQMMNQEIINSPDVAGNVQGEIIPIDVHGPDNDGVFINGVTDNDPLLWSYLSGYYRMDQKGCGYLESNFGVGVNGKLRNINSAQPETAPLPYYTIGPGDWTNVSSSGADGSSPWRWGHSVWDSPNSVGIDKTTRIDWNIVKLSHNMNSKEAGGEDGITLLGLVSDAGSELTMAANAGNLDETNTGRMLWITHYLDLNGSIDLVGESQLLQKRHTPTQFSESILNDASLGYIERDQQGTGNLYHYNDWSSPVSKIAEPKGTPFSVGDVLLDGTASASPSPILWVGGHDGKPTTPSISIADYWIYAYRNFNGNYSNWEQIRSGGDLYEGEGYLMKGPGKPSDENNIGQNYVFKGKPHNGNIDLSVAAGWTYLAGNPYPSALDAHQFIDDNFENTTGTLYFWEHWGTETHILRDYQAGYAIYTKAGGTVASAIWDSKGGSKKPQKYIPVGQAFYVVGDAGGPIKFKNNQRAFVTEADDLKSIFLKSTNTKAKKATGKVVEDKRLKIRIAFKIDNVAYRQLLCTIDENTTDEYDKGYDGDIFQLFPDDMYMVLNDRKLAIQAFGELEPDRAIPIGILTKGEGIVKIYIEEIENPYQDMEIYLRDNLTMETFDILNNTFEVDLEKGEFNDKYAIVFSPENSLSVGEEYLFDNVLVFTNENNSLIMIRKPEELTVTKISLFNIIGQQLKVWQSNYLDEIEMALPINVSAGVYFVYLDTDKGRIMKKIIVK